MSFYARLLKYFCYSDYITWVTINVWWEEEVFEVQPDAEVITEVGDVFLQVTDVGDDALQLHDLIQVGWSDITCK